MNKTIASVSLLVFVASLVVGGLVFAYSASIPLAVQLGAYLLAALALAALALGLRNYPALLREHRFAQHMDNRLQQCMNLAEVIYVVLDRKGCVVTINDTGCNLLELPRRDIVGKNWFEHFIPADESGKVRKVFDNVVSGEIQGIEYFENRIRTGSGSERVIFWHNTYTTDADNQIVFAFSAGMDLTDRLEIENRLRQSESKYQLLLDTLPYGVQEIDLDGTIVYSNPEHDRIYGYAPGTMSGLNICDLPANETTRQELRDYLGLLVRQQPPPEPYQSQDRRKDGTLFDCNVNWNYKRDEHGQLIGFIAVLSDVTQQKNTERALREAYRGMEHRVDERTAQLNAAKDLLQRTLDASPDWIYAKDRDFRFLVVNRSFAAAHGLQPQQMVNRRNSDFWSTGDSQDGNHQNQQNAHSDDQRALAGEIIHNPHDVITLQDGSVRIFDTIKGPLRNPDGEIYGVFAYARDVSEKMQAEERLESSYRLLDTVFESSHVKKAVLDREMNFIRVNQAYAAVENQPPDYFIGKNHFALYPSEENEAIFRRVVETGTRVVVHAKPFEYANHPERGVTHWDWSLSPIFDSSGQVSAVVLNLLDVTSRIRALEDLATREQELRQLNATLEQRVQARTADLEETHSFTQAIVDTVSALILAMDASGRIVRFNHACELTSGYSAEEALGRYPWDFLIPEEERIAVREVFDKLAAGNFPNTYENAWLHKSGERRMIAWMNTCMTDTAGNISYVIATGVDITEHKQTEAALALSEEKYRAIMSYASDAMFIATLDGKLIESNARGLALLGYRKEELLQLSIPDIHPPEELPRIQQVFQEMIENGSALYSDGIVLTKEQQKIPIEIACAVIEYGGKKVALGIFRDISARKRAEQKRLEQERRHRETLVREVHHRIKNNLQGLIGLLRDNLADPTQDKGALDRAIAQIRTISLVHGMQARDVSTELRLCDVTRAVFEQLRGLVPQGVRMEFHDQVSAPVLLQEQDAIPIALIINELITNAIKHIPAEYPDKSIVVSLSGSAAEGMEFTVFNEGARLPADMDLFAGKGLGMGLDLVRSLVPRKHASFDLYEDEGGVFAQLLLAPPLISPTDTT